MHRQDLTDAQWACFASLLPPQKPHTGRPNKDHRTIRNGINWILRTGAPWRDFPERYGPWRTVYRRCRRWQPAGIWDEILRQLHAEPADDGTLAGSLTMIDGSTIRAHQHAASARKGGTPPTRG